MGCTQDTTTIALSTVDGALEADIKVSVDPANDIEVKSDGLFVGGKLMWGYIKGSDASTLASSGSGFSVVRTSSEHFAITFSPAFTVPIGVIVSSNNAYNEVAAEGITGSGCTIRSQSNVDFTFVVLS